MSAASGEAPSESAASGEAPSDVPVAADAQTLLQAAIQDSVNIERLGYLWLFAIGAVWLAGIVGFEKAIALGVTPFIVGGVLKSALAAATLRLFPNGKAEPKQP